MAAGRDLAKQIIGSCRSVLLVDWPSPEVPATLALAGWAVHVKGGPGRDDFSVWEVVDGSPVSRETRRRPTRIDLVYVHRPMEELPGIISMALEMGAQAIWYGSELKPNDSAAYGRSLVEAAGLLYVDDQDIVDVVRAV